MSAHEKSVISSCGQNPELRLGDWEEKEEEDDHGDADREQKGCTGGIEARGESCTGGCTGGREARGALHHFC